MVRVPGKYYATVSTLSNRVPDLDSMLNIQGSMLVMRVQHTNEARPHGAKGKTLKRVRTDLETVRNWYMWFTQGLGHLAGRKGGETRYWVYVIRHLNIAYPVHPPG
jgi:hypothetical protein